MDSDKILGNWKKLLSYVDEYFEDGEKENTLKLFKHFDRGAVRVLLATRVQETRLPPRHVAGPPQRRIARLYCRVLLRGQGQLVEIRRYRQDFGHVVGTAFRADPGLVEQRRSTKTPPDVLGEVRRQALNEVEP